MSSLFKKTVAYCALIMTAGISMGTMVAIPEIVGLHRRKMNIKHQEKVNDQRAALVKTLWEKGVKISDGNKMAEDTYKVDNDYK